MIPSTNRPTTTFVYMPHFGFDFWVYSQGQYHRFVWRAGCLQYIRSQQTLPPFTEGNYLQVNPTERGLLEEQAARGGFTMTFFDSDSDCNRAISAEDHSQYIFDRVPPAGYFFSADQIGKGKKA